MVNKKPPAKPTHVSSKLVAPPTNPLLVSAFSPSELRLSLFASTILGLDSQRLRIHDTATGRLRCEHVFDKGVTINSLSWGTIPAASADKNAKKKRKRLSNGAAGEEGTVVVAAATGKGDIILFSVTEGKIIGSLEGGHLGEVREFLWNGEGKGWSCGSDRKLVEWDVTRRITLRTINLPDSTIRRLAPVPDSHVLSASHTIYAIDVVNPGMTKTATFSANTTPIHTLIASGDNKNFLSAADTDRFINVFSISENRHIGALVAESDVKAVSIHKAASREILAAVTSDGVVEIFQRPFEPVPKTEATPAASRKRKTLTRKGEAVVKIVRPEGKGTVAISDASLQEEELVVAWVDSGVNVEFEKIRWANPEDGSLILAGTVEIARNKNVGIGAPAGAVMNGVKDIGKSAVDQSRTVVVGGGDNMDVGMSDAEDLSDAEAVEEIEASSDDDEDQKETEELSFADKFQALQVSTAAKSASALAATSGAKKQISLPSAGSLTTVLTQALKTNDTVLLESCLHTTDSNIILATVRRLNSTMAVDLLERLAERIARRPGRAGSLGVWVRWTLVAHGGYLVSLPNLMRTLSGLYSTLNTRAGALPKLLALQGRLDMLHAQVDLRNSLRSGMGAEDKDEGVLYVEGEGDSEDSEDEEVGMEGLQIEDASFIGARREDSEDESMGDDSESEEENGFLDIEASETEAEEDGDEESVDYEDVDEEEESEEDTRKAKGRGRR